MIPHGTCVLVAVRQCTLQNAVHVYYFNFFLNSFMATEQDNRQLKTGGFYGSKVLLSARVCRWQLVHSQFEALSDSF